MMKSGILDVYVVVGERVSEAKLTINGNYGPEVAFNVRQRRSDEGEGQPWLVTTTGDPRDVWGRATFAEAFDFALGQAKAALFQRLELSLR